jgi:hypothetical protein
VPTPAVQVVRFPPQAGNDAINVCEFPAPGVQATRYSSVPRLSCANAERSVTSSATILSGRIAPARSIRAHEVVTLRIKQHSRHRALKDLAKIFRMEVERQEISGPSGGPVEVTDHRARITERLDAIAKRTAPANDGASGST